jgi:hypothetical protein
MEGTVGTVQLVFGQPENQPHRADLSYFYRMLDT